MILIINCRLYHRSMSMYCTCECTYVKYCTVCKRRTILFCHQSGRCLNGRGGKIQEPTIFSLMLCRYKARTWTQDFCPTFDDICCQNVARFQQQWTLISKNTGNWSTSKTFRFKSGIEDSFLDSGPFLHEASLIESRAQRQLELQLSKSQVFKKERGTVLPVIQSAQRQQWVQTVFLAGKLPEDRLMWRCELLLGLDWQNTVMNFLDVHSYGSVLAPAFLPFSWVVFVQNGAKIRMRPIRFNTCNFWCIYLLNNKNLECRHTSI